MVVFQTLLCIWAFLSPGPILELLHEFGVNHDGSWKGVVEATQKAWVHPNQERWEIEPIKDPNPSCSYALFTELGMTAPRYVYRLHYDTAVVLGATRPVVKTRLDFLLEETERGITFNQLVILTGDRPLLLSEGNTNDNETAMIQELLTHYPWEATMIDTPCKPGQRRPTTIDTFEYWFEQDAHPGRTLVVTSQPFIPRQDAIARLFLSEEMETIGPGVTYETYLNTSNGCAIMLDELGRWLYQAISPTINVSKEKGHCDW